MANVLGGIFLLHPRRVLDVDHFEHVKELNFSDLKYLADQMLPEFLSMLTFGSSYSPILYSLKPKVPASYISHTYIHSLLSTKLRSISSSATLTTAQSLPA